MIHRNRRVCIERDVFDSKLGACVNYLAHDSDDCDYDVCDDNGCVNVVEASDCFDVHPRRLVLNEN